MPVGLTLLAIENTAAAVLLRSVEVVREYGRAEEEHIIVKVQHARVNTPLVIVRNVLVHLKEQLVYRFTVQGTPKMRLDPPHLRR